MGTRKLHLVCNAHLDPAWLWELEEGAGEALSTFRIAADFCEQYDAFIFNHNEVILYKWVEEYDPNLFRRIQELVSQGRWVIMGGWYLQPDCNMPSGESFVRQILLGKNYFREKFGVEPTTAINFDPFGHTRGLVQILRKSGYDSYVFCRPDENDCPLPSDDFIWVGYDGSRVIGHRAFNAYLSGRGKAHIKVQNWLDAHPDNQTGMVLWGIGNHGGGPSQIDIQNLQEMMEGTDEFEMMHSTVESYISDLRLFRANLPEHTGDLNPWAVGCYTSQIRVKQKHRLLENELYMVEKMVSSAALQGYLEYPHAELYDATCDLMISEFHDILPGSSISRVEENSLRLLDHGLEILARVRARAFFALTAGQPQAAEGEVPVFVYNPHPIPITGTFECELQLPKASKEQFANLALYVNGQRVPCQVEKEVSNLGMDWRKRIAFHATLEPSQMNRFDCQVEFLDEKPPIQLVEQNGKLLFVTSEIEVIVNCQTGLIDAYKVHGAPFLRPGACRPLVVEDNDDSWGCKVKSFPNVTGVFELMDPVRGTKYSGVTETVLSSVRVVEDGDARSVIEALFEYGDSFICQTYLLPKHGTEIEVRQLVHWNEKRKMLKWSVPTLLEDGAYMGQVAYGTDVLPNNGQEVVAQKWVGLVSKQRDLALTCTNDGIYGSDSQGGEIRLSLLRSPGYSGLPSYRPQIMPQNRFSEHIDQGERAFQFWINAGPANRRMRTVDSEALAHNEKPYLLSYFPSGQGTCPKPLIFVSGGTVQLTTFKRAEHSDDYIVRLFEPTGETSVVTVGVPALAVSQTVTLHPFEIKTLRLDVTQRALVETNLMESS